MNCLSDKPMKPKVFYRIENKKDGMGPFSAYSTKNGKKNVVRSRKLVRKLNSNPVTRGMFERHSTIFPTPYEEGFKSRKLQPSQRGIKLEYVCACKSRRHFMDNFTEEECLELSKLGFAIYRIETRAYVELDNNVMLIPGFETSKMECWPFEYEKTTVFKRVPISVRMDRENLYTISAEIKGIPLRHVTHDPRIFHLLGSKNVAMARWARSQAYNLLKQ